MKSTDETPAYSHPWREKNRVDEGVRNTKRSFTYLCMHHWVQCLCSPRTGLHFRLGMSKTGQNSDLHTWKILLLSLQCSLTYVGGLLGKEKTSESSNTKLTAEPLAGHFLEIVWAKAAVYSCLTNIQSWHKRTDTTSLTPCFPLHHFYWTTTSQSLNLTVLQTRQPPYLGG